VLRVLLRPRRVQGATHRDPDNDQSGHGTRVIISKLKRAARLPQRCDDVGKLRAKLGDVYAFQLANEGV
jgi:hypothetical protein